VLSRDEVLRLLDALTPEPRLAASLLYGAGLRVSEALRLRIKDLDLDRLQLQVKAGKGRKDRTCLLPERVLPSLRVHLDTLRDQHRRDLRLDAGWVDLPRSMARKAPSHGRRWSWQWVFPSHRVCWLDAGRRGRRLLSPSTLQRALARAARKASLMGHADVRTTMLYVHVAKTEIDGCRSPLDPLG
jgi:integrase